MTTTPLRKVAFLDTNVLHYMDLYLRQAKEEGLFPFGGDETTARKNLKAIEYESLKSDMNKGLNLIEHLLRNDTRVEYSPVSELELMAGRARGKAIEKAAAEGIPDRMWWGRFTDSMVGDRLVDSDLATIEEAVEGLRRLLDEAGIDAAVGKTDRTRDVLELAKDVMGLVYMSSIDSVIYAAALVAEAYCMISEDKYLRDTVNRLKKESVVKGKLESRMAAVLLRKPGSITLPDARRIPRSGKH